MSLTSPPPSDPSRPDLSIIVPLFNEQENVTLLHAAITSALTTLARSYEIIYIDDGSRDRTAALIEEIAQRDAHVTALLFTRNFGQTAAMSAGIEAARGDIIIPMDGDLQNDPTDIARLLEKLNEGFDVVSGWRKDRKDAFIRVLPSKIANFIISRVSGVRLHDYGCSLKAYRRRVIQGVPLYGEMHRFIPVYATWQGAKVTEIPVTHHPRQHGVSKYGMGRILKVILDLMVVKFLSSYLTKPIYFFGGFGLLCMLGSLLTFLLALTFKLIPPDNPWDPQWHKDFIQTPLPSLSVGLFVIGVQMMLMGILAEMIMRTYFESQNRRPFVIRKICKQ